MRKIICITTYPPRECGIATFSQDLIQAVVRQFGKSYSVKICAVESDSEQHSYNKEVAYTLNTSVSASFTTLTRQLNDDPETAVVLVQHEFGLYIKQEEAFLQMLENLNKPVVLVFHTVLSRPSAALRQCVDRIATACLKLVVMTRSSANILQNEYRIKESKITVIPHGTHLVSFRDKNQLKEEYGFSGRRILSTFGLISAGKSIETTLNALPDIVRKHPSVLFLVIGKTHPGVIKTEGEQYRHSLEAKVKELHLEPYVHFINEYVELTVLLDYLQLTDIYLFTSGDPNQAVSGTFVYALSCGCPIIATPIPHALELLNDDSGIIFPFKDSARLAKAANLLLADEDLRLRMGAVGLQKTAATAWQNAAIAYVRLFRQIEHTEELIYSLPPVDTCHLHRMSPGQGIIQFSKGNRPDEETGCTLDDTARALIALCRTVNAGKGKGEETYIGKYLDFIRFCQQPDGSFLNYVDRHGNFTVQNEETGLEDSNGRAVCALGYFISCSGHFSPSWQEEATDMLNKAVPHLATVSSPRSMAFAIKGLYYNNLLYPSAATEDVMERLADQLVGFYRSTATEGWFWFENYLTYDNSILPEALLLAYLVIGRKEYKETAQRSFDFLLQHIFTDNQIRVISNQGWLFKGKGSHPYGEQPVDVAGTVITLNLFYKVFKKASYLRRQTDAFNWFLGNNHLHQIIYNPATGGCYDGLEKNNVNLNQGAESGICYLTARMAMEKN